MPPISESLKRNKKVPSGLLMSRSWACCLFTKPRMALGAWSIQRHCWAGSHCPLGPCPSHCRAHCFSPVIPMGLVMLLQHLHDPIKPLPEGVVPARQVLLRSPRKPQVRACAAVITGGPANSQRPLIFTQTLSRFLILLVPHSAAPNPYPRKPESTCLWPLGHRGLRQPHGVGDRRCKKLSELDETTTVIPAQPLYFTDGETWHREGKGLGKLVNGTN